MTANQIAAEANAIRRDELAETTRHNQATESNEYTRNAITEEYNHKMVELKNQELWLNKQLKELELAISKAIGDEKNRLTEQYNSVQEQLADIKQQEVDNDKQYKSTLGLVETEKVEESVRHNVANESISGRANVIRNREVDILEKEAASRVQLNTISAKEKRGKFSTVLGDVFDHGDSYVNEHKSSVNITDSTSRKSTIPGHSPGKF